MNLFKFITKYRLLMAFIVAAGLFLRFYHLEERFNFHAELNVKAWTIKNLLVDHRLPPVGIEAVSYLHHLFYPPLFQFFGAFIFCVANLNPVGMEVFLVLLFIPSIILVYLTTRELSGKKTAVLASFIYSFSLFIDSASRFIWVVGPMLLISLIVLFIIIKINLSPKKLKYYFLLGIVIGVGFNFHYQTFILFISIILWLLLNRKRVSFVKSICLFFVPIIIAFSPLIVFDLRHDFFNFRGVLLLITANKINSFTQNMFGAVVTYWQPIFSLVSIRLKDFVNQGSSGIILSIVFDLLIIACAFSLYHKNRTAKRQTFLFIFFNFILAFFALPFIQNRYYGSEYYLYFLIPYAVVLFSIGIKNLYLHRQFAILIILATLFIYENINLVRQSFIKNNYAQQLRILDQLLKPFSYQKKGAIRIYYEDFPSENNSYLIYYLSHRRQIDFNVVKIYEPWQSIRTWDIKINRKLFK